MVNCSLIVHSFTNRKPCSKETLVCTVAYLALEFSRSTRKRDNSCHLHLLRFCLNVLQAVKGKLSFLRIETSFCSSFDNSSQSRRIPHFKIFPANRDWYELWCSEK